MTCLGLWAGEQLGLIQNQVCLADCKAQTLLFTPGARQRCSLSGLAWGDSEPAAAWRASGSTEAA